ncbi:MAG: prenyltransferase, partial [Woeseiaceae bacterium]|nr:prenyltransferase [Woeseiaceae bacterium]
MPQQSARPINPATEDFAGNSLSRAAKRAFHATRPKFFPASILPVLAGTAWGAYVAGQIDVYVFLLALLATVSVHAASNVLNDVSDEIIGTDRLNEQRIYPHTGGSRFIQMGILTQPRMARLGVALLVLAALAGLALFVEKGPVVLLFGIAGVALAVLYSLGPLKLSALGLGETAIVIAFGVLPVSGAAWLQGAPIDSALLLFSLPVGIWVSAILLINEV